MLRLVKKDFRSFNTRPRRSQSKSISFLPVVLPKSIRSRQDLKLQIRKVFLFCFFPFIYMGDMGSWSMTNTETIFFTLGNITCFLELMEKYSLETNSTIPLIKLATNSSTKESIRVKTMRTQRHYIPFLSALNNYPKHIFF